MKRLRRNEVIHPHQAEFSPILFDMLFGLLIFLGFGAFASVKGSAHFVFLTASLAVAVHWWLKRKASNETFGVETANSTLSLLFGIAEVVLLQMAMLAAAQKEYATAITYFTMPLLLESVWALLMRFFGKWRHSTAKRVRFMEQQLEYTIFLNLIMAVIFGAIVTFSQLMFSPDIVLSFILGYASYALLTHRLEMVNVKML